jgi:hypothetical protein
MKQVKVIFKVKVILRPTVSRLLCPGFGLQSGTHYQIYPLFHGNCLRTDAGFLSSDARSNQMIGL